MHIQQLVENLVSAYLEEAFYKTVITRDDDGHDTEVAIWKDPNPFNIQSMSSFKKYREIRALFIFEGDKVKEIYAWGSMESGSFHAPVARALGLTISSSVEPCQIGVDEDAKMLIILQARREGLPVWTAARKKAVASDPQFIELAKFWDCKVKVL